MRSYFITFILFISIALPSISFSDDGFKTYYDKEKDWFVFEWKGVLTGRMMKAVYDPRNKIKPNVKMNAKVVNSSDSILEYSYTVSNAKDALRSVAYFFIPEISGTYDIKNPSGTWKTGIYAKTDYRFWYKLRELDTIKAGETVSGFSFKVKSIPVIIESALTGRQAKKFRGPGLGDSAFLDEAMETALANYKEQYPEKFSRVHVKTVGPTAPPKDLNATDFMQGIIDMKHQSQDLGWIKEEGAKGIIGGLDKKLDNALKAIKNGNLGSAKNILEAFIQQVEAQGCETYDDCHKGKHLMPEAYALLKFNAQYLIDNM